MGCSTTCILGVSSRAWSFPSFDWAGCQSQSIYFFNIHEWWVKPTFNLAFLAVSLRYWLYIYIFINWVMCIEQWLEIWILAWDYVPWFLLSLCFIFLYSSVFFLFSSFYLCYVLIHYCDLFWLMTLIYIVDYLAVGFAKGNKCPSM